jgi:hypothetical protein
MPKERGTAMKGITLQEMSDDTVQQLHANYVRQPAFSHTQGTAEAYTVKLDPNPISLADGFGITIVPHVTNEAEVTLNINELGALSLKDQKGNPFATGKLQAGKPYTFRKVGTDFLADSSDGSGDAIAGDIRAGKIATTDNGEIVGTMPTRSNVFKAGSYFNDLHNTFLDSEVTLDSGYYPENTQVRIQINDSNFKSENIKSGITIFGEEGSYIGSGNATAGDLRAGKTATTDNGEVAGELPVRTGGTVVPSTVNQIKQAGIYDSDIVVQGSSNLVAGNIRKGVNLFNISGSLEAIRKNSMTGNASSEYNTQSGSTSYFSIVTIPPCSMGYINRINEGLSYSIRVLAQFLSASDEIPGLSVILSQSATSEKNASLLRHFSLGNELFIDKWIFDITNMIVDIDPGKVNINPLYDSNDYGYIVLKIINPINSATIKTQYNKNYTLNVV